MTSSEESDGSTDDESDAEWRKTPLVKRIRQERRSMATGLSKRKRDSVDSEDDRDEDTSLSKKKAASSSLGCTCKKGCKTKACSCKKKCIFCTALCKCDRHTCANR